ncbi:creatininase [Ignicoccus islandicus DSM 13165]|uniref:Creatininase n=1 Tax=Ignicoccus islandicus DSM 13165 TaxID=940295 RepID=A0A0U3EBZ7_9CREN|nr:creatininase family protein [Ignicoccus islandicus]ALU11987.1 creatininase [Ignicoccus islandicus DSM 13165]
MKLYFLPIGSYEPHPTLPYDIDTRIARAFAEILAKEVGGTVLPPLSYSSSWEWEGSISLRIETISLLLRDLNSSIIRIGGRLIVINAHGGNVGLLDAIARQEGFYVIHFYKACGIKPGHSGEVECNVAKALGLIDRTCSKGSKWPREAIVKPRIELGSYDEEELEFHEVLSKIQRCAFKLANEISKLS